MPTEVHFKSNFNADDRKVYGTWLRRTALIYVALILFGLGLMSVLLSMKAATVAFQRGCHRPGCAVRLAAIRFHYPRLTLARLAAWTFLATAWAVKDLIELHDAAIELEERASHGEHLTKQEKELIHKEAAKMLSESRHRQQYQPHQPEPHPHAAGGSVRRQRSLINSFN